MNDSNVRMLPVKPRPDAGERFLVPVPHTKCQHYKGPFEVDVDGGKCKCLACGDEVTAIFVLEHLMHKESRWMVAHDTYQDEMRRLAERSSTKCQHCEKMTRISRA